MEAGPAIAGPRATLNGIWTVVSKLESKVALRVQHELERLTP